MQTLSVPVLPFCAQHVLIYLNMFKITCAPFGKRRCNSWCHGNIEMMQNIGSIMNMSPHDNFWLQVIEEEEAWMLAAYYTHAHICVHKHTHTHTHILSNTGHGPSVLPLESTEAS